MISKFLFQWHITSACNLRCKHCYQSAYGRHTSIDDLKLASEQLGRFKRYYNASAHVNLTGGEPLLSPYIYDVLDMLTENEMTFGLLTNGTLIDEITAKRLCSYKKLTYVQISIDGGEAMHDSIRGEGNFSKAMHGASLIRKYSKRRIPVYASFTAHKNNMDALHDAVEACRKNKIDFFWTDRLIPFGQADSEMCMSPDEVKRFLDDLSSEASRNRRLFSNTFVKTGRALQFYCNCGFGVYHCEAGDTFFTIDEDLQLLPCRRMPIKIGDLHEDELVNLYQQSDILGKLRLHRIPDDCKGCLYEYSCRGGLKCLAYALNGDFDTIDPGCFMSPAFKSARL